MKSPRSNLKSAVWAVFLGCSWTWCIGMFLPVIFLWRLGVWGWIVFAIPNVVGAAAMGWVLSQPLGSERIVREHAAACSFFSAVTIAFHIFFLLWFVPRLIGLPLAASAFGIVSIYLLATIARPRSDVPAAAIVWIFSAILLVLFLGRSTPIHVLLHGAESSLNAIWLAPVCVFGFLFNPYLDLTFHRARQALDANEARLAFGVGFGFFFFAMIVFTLLYAATISPLLAPEWRDHLRPALGSLIAAHMIVQAAYTLSVHVRSFVLANPGRGTIFTFLLLAQGAMLLGLASNLLPRFRGLDPGEIIYLLFMGFYAMIFPTYVWLCMLPGRDGIAGANPAKIRTLVLSVVIAFPMFWLGFIERQWVWLAPGIAVLVLSRFAVPRRAPLEPSRPAAADRATHAIP